MSNAMQSVISMDTLEREITERRRSSVELVSTAKIGDKDIGRLSGEAVLGQYDVAALAVTNMGEEVKDRIRNLELAMFEADKDLKLIAEAAAFIKDKGKLVQQQIEEASNVSTSIRALCLSVRKKIGQPPEEE